MSPRASGSGSPKPPATDENFEAGVRARGNACAAFVMKYRGSQGHVGSVIRKFILPNPTCQRRWLGTSAPDSRFGTAAGPAQSGRVDVGYRPATPRSLQSLALVSDSAGSTATDMCRVRALAVRPGSGRFASSWLLVGIARRLWQGQAIQTSCTWQAGQARNRLARPGTG